MLYIFFIQNIQDTSYQNLITIDVTALNLIARDFTRYYFFLDEDTGDLSK